MQILRSIALIEDYCYETSDNTSSSSYSLHWPYETLYATTDCSGPASSSFVINQSCVYQGEVAQTYSQTSEVSSSAASRGRDQLHQSVAGGLLVLLALVSYYI